MKIKPEIVSKSTYAIIIILVILLSFRLFSTVFSPAVNSDEAVIVLMLHYFHLPGDLYFWGQDRYGAIVPFLGQVPFRLFGLSSLVSEAITHYLLLIAGFLALSSFIRLKLYRILFAVTWFLPALYYTDLLKNVFGLQYAIIGILFYFFSRYQALVQNKGLLSKLSYLLLILLSMITAFWVSDLAITSVLAFLIINAFFIIKEEKVKSIFRKPEAYLLIFSLVVTYLIISGLKSLVDTGPYDNYGDKLLNDFPSVIKSITLLFSGIGSILSFRVHNFLFSIYAYLLIILIIIIFIYRKKIKADRQEGRWAAVFILDGILLIGIVLMSNWALVNELPRRYFVGVHISFWFVFLMLFSFFSPGGIKKVITFLTVFAIGIGTLSTFYNYKYINPKSFKPKAEVVREFSKLGRIGIIADYWNSYSSSFADPDRIKATPYELSYSVRNFELIDSVFAQPGIILIRDMWMGDFPDSIMQFDRTLLRKDSSFFMGGCQCCEYTIKRNWMFDINGMKHMPGYTSFDKLLGKEVLKVGEGYEACIYKHVVFGPFITLLKGRYEVSFDIRFDSVFTNNDIAELDVVSDYGQNKMASLTLKPSLIPSIMDFHEYKMEFHVDEKNPTIEFRIYYLGGAYLTFDRISVRQISD